MSVLLLLVAMATTAVPIRQIGQVVSATCALTNGTSFCVPGFVASETATTTKASGMQTVASWKFAGSQVVSEMFLGVENGARTLTCDPNQLSCFRDGVFSSFGNDSFSIDFRMRSNVTSETMVVSGSGWSIWTKTGSTLQFRFQTMVAGEQSNREFIVESHQVTNDGQWRDVRFSRSPASGFAFAFDGVPESNLTLDIPSEKIVDISLPMGVYNTFRIALWELKQKYPAGVIFDTVSISVGEYNTTDLFSFDTATGGNVVLGDVLVNTVGCARNSTLCQSCAYCTMNYASNTFGRIYDTYGNRLSVVRPEVARAACPAPKIFLTREEGACCGHCHDFYELAYSRFCKYRPGCAEEFVSAHECRQCGITNAEIACAREQSAMCAAETVEVCKLNAAAKNFSCSCDGQIAKQPAAVCSNESAVFGADCYPQPDGSIKMVNQTQEFALCTGRNNRMYELDINRAHCFQVDLNRKRASDYACIPGQPTTASSSAVTVDWWFVLLSVTALQVCKQQWNN